MKNPVVIISRDNSWFQRFRKAVDRHDEEIVLEGPKQIADAIANGWEPIAHAFDESHDDCPSSALAFASPLFRALSDTRHSQGELALFHRPGFTLADLPVNDAPLVVLDAVQDPGNVGTVIRTAAAFEAGAVICLDGCADPFSPKSIRASVGTVLRIPVISSTLGPLLAFAAERTRPLYAASGRGASTGLPPSRSILIFGSEGQGVRPEVLRHARLFRIATSPLVESLNIAAAAAIVLSRLYGEREAEVF